MTTMLMSVLPFTVPLVVLYNVFGDERITADFREFGGLAKVVEQGDKPRSRKTGRRAIGFVKLNDKISFTLMVVNIVITSYILGAAPEYFYISYSIKGLFFFPHMYRKYAKLGWQLFFYDFCYVVNGLCYVYCWLYPDPFFFKMLFAIANGPLAWSIIVFGNSLVFHDWAKIFSVFIHLNPALLTFSIRWHAKGSFFPLATSGEYSKLAAVFGGMKYIYVPWCLAYYTWIFIIMEPQLDGKTRMMTLYEYMTEAGGMGIFKQMTPNSYVNKALYVLMHLVSGSIAMLGGSLLWHSKLAHMLFITSILIGACWNSAEHYFDDFSRKYEEDLTARLSKAGYNVKKAQIKLDEIPEDILNKTIDKVAQIAGVKKDSVKPDNHLMFDVGMQSITVSELIGWIEAEYNIQDVAPADLSTVASVAWMINAKKPKPGEEVEIKAPDTPEGWVERKRPDPIAPEGDILPVAFWNNAMRLRNHVAIADDTTGPMTYKRMQTAVVLLADYIQRHPEIFPGEHIGLMLPASSGVAIMAFALMMAGKVPVMINWTHGSSNLIHVLKTAKIKCVLTAKKFTTRIAPTVNLEVFKSESGKDLMVFYEDIKEQLYITDMMYASVFLSRMTTAQVMDRYQLHDKKSSDPAVILFTSGSESAPKGVPLSHGNILSNVAGIVDVMLRSKPEKTDTLMGCLPPFHSFGWTATTCAPLTTGIKVAYYVSPTDSKQLVLQIAKWQASIFLGTPRFLSGVFAAAARSPELLKSLRLCVTGAEKLPNLVIEKAKEYGVEDGVIEGYGITETSPVLSVNVPGQPNEGVGSVIRTKPPTEVAIVKEEKAGKFVSVSPGEKGLILARGPSVFGGYLPGTTKKVPFVEYNGSKDWYDTGDLGRLEAKKEGKEGGGVGEAKLYLMGRTKRFVKYAGEMVSLPKIEKCLQSRWKADSDGQATIACEGYEATEEGKTVISILAVGSIRDDLKDFQNHLKSNGIDGVHLPQRLIRVKEIPLLATGKAALGVMKWLVKYDAGFLTEKEVKEDADLKDESKARYLL